MTSKNRKVIILHTINDFEQYSLIEKDFHLNNSNIIIAYSIELRILLDQRNIDYKIQENYLNNIKAYEMDKKAFFICSNWYKTLEKVQGFSLGLFLEWDLNYFFSRIIRQVETIDTIIKVENPATIVSCKRTSYYFNEFNNALEHICSLRNVPLDLISKEKAFQKKKENKKFLLIIYEKIQTQILNILAKIFFHLPNRKLKIFAKKKNILAYRSGYYPSISQISRIHNLIYLTDNANKLIIQNFINLFFKNRNKYYLCLYPLESRKLRKRTKKIHNHLLNKWTNEIDKSNFKKVFFYNNISLWPLVERNIHQYIQVDFKRIIKLILTINRLFTKWKFDLLVSSHDVLPISKALTFFANKTKTPSMVIQHGIPGDPYGAGIIPSFSTKVVVWGNLIKDWLIKYGMKFEKLAVTGSPRFDRYLLLNKNENFKRRIRNKITEQLGIQKDKTIFLFATSWGRIYRRFNYQETLFEIHKLQEFLIESVKNLPNSHLIIKLHPGDITGHIPIKLKNIYGVENISIVKDINIMNLIIACDCFIAGRSTTVVEAMTFEKPFIYYILSNLDEHNLYCKLRNFKTASNYNEIFDEMKNFIKNPKSKIDYIDFLKGFLYKLDGLSTKRLFNLIEKMML